MTADNSFDAVIIGSGFGGSINAYRLAAAGRRVCVLERGKSYEDGRFPRNVRDTSALLWRWPSPRKSRGLYQFRMFSALGTVVASGLGGGSLVYANVNVRPDPRVFETCWPAGFDRASLDPYYDRVAGMLHVGPVSSGIALNKTRAMKEAARAVGKETDLFEPDLGVYWGNGQGEEAADPYGYGVRQQPCQLIAECEFGCVHGAKNTLDLNYLAVARSCGAEIRVNTAAVQIEPVGEVGYRVWTVDTVTGEKSSVTGKRVVVSAGTIGTNELLLKCRDLFKSLPQLSSQLGHRFSANGDFLANLMRARDDLEPWRGPDVTAVIRYFDDPPWFTLAAPTFNRPVMSVLAAMGQGTNPFFRLLAPALRPWLNSLIPLLLRSGAVSRPIRLPWARVEDPGRMTILFAIGKDSADGRIALGRGKRRIDIVWDYEERNRELIARMTKAMRQLAEGYGGTFDIAPTWKYFRRIVTVHPLGGCVMADSPDNGVVSPQGEVFNYPGLFVADGSVIPSSIGFHPAMTISAVAERISDHVVSSF